MLISDCPLAAVWPPNPTGAVFGLFSGWRPMQAWQRAGRRWGMPFGALGGSAQEPLRLIQLWTPTLGHAQGAHNGQTAQMWQIFHRVKRNVSWQHSTELLEMKGSSFSVAFFICWILSRKSSLLCTANAYICIYIIFYDILAKLLFSYDKYMQSLSYLVLIFKNLALQWKQGWIVPAKAVLISCVPLMISSRDLQHMLLATSLSHSDRNSGKAHSMSRRSTEDLLKSQGWVKLIAFIINIPIFIVSQILTQ